MESIIQKVINKTVSRANKGSFKVALYCRVSTGDQTPENQKIRLTEYADKEGWDYDVYSEVQSTKNTSQLRVT